jgi:hypothetical protein
MTYCNLETCVLSNRCLFSLTFAVECRRSLVALCQLFITLFQSTSFLSQLRVEVYYKNKILLQRRLFKQTFIILCKTIYEIYLTHPLMRLHNPHVSPVQNCYPRWLILYGYSLGLFQWKTKVINCCCCCHCYSWCYYYYYLFIYLFFWKLSVFESLLGISETFLCTISALQLKTVLLQDVHQLLMLSAETLMCLKQILFPLVIFYKTVVLSIY